MSSTERSAWIRLASLSIVFVPYFVYVLGLFEAEGPVGRAICIAFLAAGLAHGALDALGQTALFFAFGKPMHDERDAAIESMSLRVSYFALIALLLGALSTMAFLGAIERPSAGGTIVLPGFAVTSQFVFLCIVAAEALRHATQVFCYRREAFA